MSKPTFAEDDVGLMKIRYGLAAAKKTGQLLQRMFSKFKGTKHIPDSRPTVVPHTMFAGPGGCGKTRRVEAAAELMGCSEKDGTFVKLTPDAIRQPEHLMEILVSKLSWKGYMDVNGKVDHKAGEQPKIVDPKHPVAPVQNIAIFIDEIHDLQDAVLNAMLLVLYEYEYQYTGKDGKFQHLYFPKFTCFGATTDLGELPSPLQTRFPNQIEIEYYTDEEMVDIVHSMVEGRDLDIEKDAAKMLAYCSQGVARMAENHVRGLYEAACYHQPEQTAILTTDLAMKYLSTAQYLPDGLKYRQVMILEFLANRGEKNGSPIPAGEQAICDSIGVDKTLYKQNLEPRLMHRDLILRTARGRSITLQGAEYLKRVKAEFPSILE